MTPFGGGISIKPLKPAAGRPPGRGCHDARRTDGNGGVHPVRRNGIDGDLPALDVGSDRGDSVEEENGDADRAFRRDREAAAWAKDERVTWPGAIAR